jgi:hypothetical protein
VKHGAHVHVFNLYTDGVGNPEVPEKFQQAKEKEHESSGPTIRCRGWLHCRAFYKTPATATLKG